VSAPLPGHVHHQALITLLAALRMEVREQLAAVKSNWAKVCGFTAALILLDCRKIVQMDSEYEWIINPDFFPILVGR
jgi:hypothetical protein